MIPDSLRESLRGFPVIVPAVPVAWGEMDAFNHVNNAVYFRWFETARIAYFERIGLLDHMRATGVGPILAETRCRYRRPLSFPDTLTLGARVSEVDAAGFMMQYRVGSAALGTHAAEGDGRIVIFDYEAGRKAALPEAIREAIHALDGV